MKADSLMRELYAAGTAPGHPRAFGQAVVDLDARLSA